MDLKLTHARIDVLEEAAVELAAALQTYDGVKDIDPGFQKGKPQIDFVVTELGQSLGLNEALVGQQVRAAFYGSEAKRQQRGIDELKVMVRLPESERRSEFDIENLMLKTPRGGEVPLRLAVDQRRGHAFTAISRTDEQRSIHVQADIDWSVTTPEQVYGKLLGPEGAVPALMKKYQGLSWGFAGEQQEQQESMGALMMGAIMALLVIYALIAIPFRSYMQPLIIMMIIPIGIGMAIFAHMVLGFNMSIISMMGIVALSGVVINDSLVLIDTANRNRAVGETAWEAIRDAGIRRFRPIMLTSLTTFGGLAPMIMETSVQARFLIPMAISLGFGILLTMPFIYLLVPAGYLVMDDIKHVCGFGPKVIEPAGPPGPPAQ